MTLVFVLRISIFAKIFESIRSRGSWREIIFFLRPRATGFWFLEEQPCCSRAGRTQTVSFEVGEGKRRQVGARTPSKDLRLFFAAFILDFTPSSVPLVPYCRTLSFSYRNSNTQLNAHSTPITGSWIFSIFANSHSLLHSGQFERVRSHFEMQSKWNTCPQFPHAMLNPSSDADVGLAWYSMEGS